MLDGAGVRYLRGPASGNPGAVRGGTAAMIVSGRPSGLRRGRAASCARSRRPCATSAQGEAARVVKLTFQILIARHRRAARRGARARRGGRRRARGAPRRDRRVGRRLDVRRRTRASRCCATTTPRPSRRRSCRRTSTSSSTSPNEVGVELPATGARPDAARGDRRERPRGRGLHGTVAGAAGPGASGSDPQREVIQVTGTPIASRGATMAVDWEQRIDFPKLRAHRLERTKAALRAVRARLPAALRPEQPALRHEHGDRHLGARQEHPLRARLPRRAADPVGLRLGRAAPPALLPVAARVELARVGAADARRHARRDRRARPARRDDLGGAARARPRHASPSAWTCRT